MVGVTSFQLYSCLIRGDQFDWVRVEDRLYKVTETLSFVNG